MKQTNNKSGESRVITPYNEVIHGSLDDALKEPEVRSENRKVSILTGKDHDGKAKDVDLGFKNNGLQ